MDKNIINFDESKRKLISKRYPNIDRDMQILRKPVLLEENVALDNFQTIFLKYQEYLLGEDGAKKIELEEVMFYFNKYFDEIYKLFMVFDSEKVPKFKEMMDYAMLSGGKRIRPFLMFVSYCFFHGKDCMTLAPFMVAMEMIHTFSLIHDDLPCMDNDTLRRGKETVWKKYGEDMGVLTGDALMMHAATILLDTIYDLGYTELGTQVVMSSLILLRLAGLDGMITGQVFDVMNTTNKDLNIDDIAFMYDKKTTALIVAAFVMGCNMAGCFGEKIEYAERIGACIGEAFQIKDDLLEIESTKEKIGKSVNSDKDNGKITYVTKVGVKKAKEKVILLEEEALRIVELLTDKYNVKDALVLKEVIKYLTRRDR